MCSCVCVCVCVCVGVCVCLATQWAGKQANKHTEKDNQTCAYACEAQAVTPICAAFFAFFHVRAWPFRGWPDQSSSGQSLTIMWSCFSNNAVLQFSAFADRRHSISVQRREQSIRLSSMQLDLLRHATQWLLMLGELHGSIVFSGIVTSDSRKRLASLWLIHARRRARYCETYEDLATFST